MTTAEIAPQHPLHTEVREGALYEGLDPGIRFAVRLLHAAGIPTCQSCQGGEGHAYEYPSIDMVDPRAFHAMEILESYGLRVMTVSSVWSVVDGVPNHRVWRVELRNHVADRRDETPMFFTGHLHSDCWESREGAQAPQENDS